VLVGDGWWVPCFYPLYPQERDSEVVRLRIWDSFCTLLYLNIIDKILFLFGFCRPSAKMTFSTSRVGAKPEEVVLREPTPPLVPPAMLSSQSLPTALDKDKLAKLLSVACSMCKPMTPAPRSVFSCFAFADTTLCCRCFEWGEEILGLRTDADTVNSHFMWCDLGKVPALL